MEYTVYFEVFGKKMKTNVYADSKSNAKEKVINKIKWHKVISGPCDNNIFTSLLDAFKIK